MQAFLNRVTFKESKLCQNLLSFNNLSLLEDDEYEDPMAFEMTAPTDTEKQNEEKAELIDCITCLSKKANCVIVPCGHCVLCMPCFDKWDGKDTSWFGLTQSGDEDSDISDSELPATATKCPICKQEIEKVVQIYLG